MLLVLSVIWLQAYPGIAEYRARRVDSPIYHLPDCPSLAAVSPGEVAIVASEAAAREARLKPCLWCRPRQDAYRVLDVIDGDTIRIEFYGSTEVVRLLYIDAAETIHGSAISRQAAEQLRAWLQGRTVILEAAYPHFRDAGSERILAYVFLCQPDGSHDNINLRLVESGLARYYVKYGRSADYDTDFETAQSAARAVKRGLWAKKRTDE